MRNEIVSILFLVSDDNIILENVKQIIQKHTKGILFLTSKNLECFEKKLNWFPTTFIIISGKSLVSKSAMELVKKLDVVSPIFLTSFEKKNLVLLPMLLKKNYKKNATVRAKQEHTRLEKIQKAKNSSLAR